MFMPAEMLDGEVFALEDDTVDVVVVSEVRKASMSSVSSEGVVVGAPQ